MSEVAAAGLGLLSNFCGVAWLALAMRAHWTWVFTGCPRTPNGRLVLRVLGGVALFASLLLFLQASHVTMASLVWVMSCAGSALAVAMVLAWRPRLLMFMAPWLWPTSSKRS